RRRRVVGRRIDRPAEGGWSRIGIPRRVKGADLEGMGARSEGRVVLAAGARAKGAAVELALEDATGLGRGEAEAGAGAVGQCRGIRGNRRIGRGGIDGPAEDRGGWIGIPRRADGADLEGMTAAAERGVTLRAGARAEGGAVELAFEGAPRRGRGKAEAGAGATGNRRGRARQ